MVTGELLREDRYLRRIDYQSLSFDRQRAVLVGIYRIPHIVQVMSITSSCLKNEKLQGISGVWGI
jgi:hypothetical protein